jgi:hypothetical protein
LLRRMVDAHPHIAIPTSEQHWLVKWYERGRGVTPEGNVAPDLVPELLAYKKFAKMGLNRQDLERLAATGLPYHEFVSGVFDLYAHSRGKPLAGDKTPGHVRRIARLHELWPGAKYVHIIRDGRDVCLSVLGWDRASKLADRLVTWKEDPLTTAAFWWEDMVSRGREAGAELGPGHYYELRYEDLIGAPETESMKLCDFLELPYDTSMLRFHEGKTKDQDGLSAKKAWLPVTSGLRDWRTQMGAESVESFEAAVGETLERVGYPRVVPDPSPRLVKHASGVRAALAASGGL